MRKISLILITISIAFTSIAQVGDYQNDSLVNYIDINKKKQGKWIKKYNDGQIRYKGFFVNDTPTGTFYYYFEDGALKSMLDYSKDGTSHCEMYHENGEMAASGKYTNENKRTGLWTLYYESGEVSAKIKYENSHANGTSILYYRNGNKIIECNYKSGTLDGSYDRYFQNGALYEIGIYKKGLRHGYFKFYEPNNRLLEEGPYHMGDKHGTWIKYADNPTPDTIEYAYGRPENWKELDDDWKERIEWSKQNQDKFKRPEDYIDNPIEFFRP